MGQEHLRRIAQWIASGASKIWIWILSLQFSGTVSVLLSLTSGSASVKWTGEAMGRINWVSFSLLSLAGVSEELWWLGKSVQASSRMKTLARTSRQMRIPLRQVEKKRHSRCRGSVAKKTLDKSIEPWKQVRGGDLMKAMHEKKYVRGIKGKESL